jgi:glycosyltransferase involved in cell wall biosynthesis
VNILFVTHRYPPRIGGVETHVAAVATRLAAGGHDVTVFSADAGSEVESKEWVEGVKLRRFRSLSPGGAFHVAPQVTASVRAAVPDVIHAHNHHSLPAFFGALGSGNVPLVVTPHYHGGSQSRLRDAMLSLYHWVGRRTLASAHTVVAVSDWECTKLAADFGADATVVPNGIEVDRFAEAAPEARDRPYLLSVGRLEFYKSVDRIIEMLPELPAFELVVAGEGPARPTLELIAADAGVADRVSFEGYVSDDRLPSLYRGASAYVTLSEFEAYGMTVGEALAANTPCVVRDAGGLANWTRFDSVSSVSTTSPKIVAAAVRAAASKTVDASLPTWDDVTDDLLAVYESVISS